MLTDTTKLDFPKNFLWGTATSAHQNEGNNIHSDWWEWEEKGNIPQKSGDACDSFNLFEEDLKLIKNLNNNCYRLSLEWAKIEPIEGQVDEKIVKHYHHILTRLKVENIKTVVTLFHFTLPNWFSKLGAFEKKENIDKFLKFCELCAKEFGDRVDYWITINEPNSYVNDSYIRGRFVPQKKDLKKALKIYYNLSRTHTEAYKILKSITPNTPIGMTNTDSYFHHNTNRVFDILATHLVQLIWTDLFYLLTKNTHDFIGLNYYFEARVSLKNLLYMFHHRKTEQDEKISNPRGGPSKRTDLNWPIYPKGIYESAKYLWQKYKKPIFITENGIADRSDHLRPRYLTEHLSYLHQAISENVPIIGYLHWTLMDNFEWYEGYNAKFGLFETDFETQKRTSRKSAHLYSEICKNNGLGEFVNKFLNIV